MTLTTQCTCGIGVPRLEHAESCPAYVKPPPKHYGSFTCPHCGTKMNLTLTPVPGAAQSFTLRLQIVEL